MGCKKKNNADVEYWKCATSVGQQRIGKHVRFFMSLLRNRQILQTLIGKEQCNLTTNSISADVLKIDNE